jgi:hypothetical protein
MDTSMAVTRAQFLIGGQVPASELGSDEWLLLINAALEHLRQHSKKYLPYVREHAKAHEAALALSGGHRFYGRPPDNITYLEEKGVPSTTTRLLPVGQFGIVSKDPNPPADVYQSKQLEEIYLFLTEKFEWVQLTRTITRAPEVRLELLFELITERDLEFLIGHRTHWWLRIIKSLKLSAEKVANEKQQHLNALEVSISGIGSILSRIRN